MSENEIKISEDLKDLVIERLGIMPPNYKLSIGGEGTFTTKELIQHVKAEDRVGEQIVKMQLNFIQALTSGKFINIINKNGKYFSN